MLVFVRPELTIQIYFAPEPLTFRLSTGTWFRAKRYSVTAPRYIYRRRRSDMYNPAMTAATRTVLVRCYYRLRQRVPLNECNATRYRLEKTGIHMYIFIYVGNMWSDSQAT